MKPTHRSGGSRLFWAGSLAAATLFGTGASAQVPYGGWSGRSFFYYPQAGFGRTGNYSWYYGRPNGFPTFNVVPFIPGGSVVVSQFGLQRSYNVVPYSSVDWTQFGNQRVYRLNPAGAAALMNRTAAERARLERERAAAEEAAEAVRKQQERWPKVQIDVTPGDATLYLDGNPIGTAASFAKRGAELRLPPGKYLLEATAKDRVPAAFEIDAREGDQLTWKESLERSSQRTAAPKPEASKTEEAQPEVRIREAKPGTGLERPTGKVRVRVTPADAKIMLDDHFVGFASMAAESKFFDAVPAGPHTLKITAEGYEPVTTEIVVSPLRPLEVLIALKKR